MTVGRRIRVGKSEWSSGDILAGLKAKDYDKVGRVLDNSPHLLEHFAYGDGSLLHYAVKHKDIKLARLALKHGADVNALISDGYTPLDAALLYEVQKSLIALLKRKGGKSPKWDEIQAEKEQRRLEREELEEKREQRAQSPEKFRFEGFNVVNAGLVSDELGKVLGGIEKAARRLKSKGFGHLLYGPLIIVSQKLEGKVFDVGIAAYKDVKAGAQYFIGSDLVVVNADTFVRAVGDSMKTLFHELGHRQWFKFLSPGQRKEWLGKYEARGFRIQPEHAAYLQAAAEKSAPIVVDAMGFRFRDWSQFNYKAFMRRVAAGQKKNRARDVLDHVAVSVEGGNPKTARRKMVERETARGQAAYWAHHMEKLSRYMAGELNAEDLPRSIRRDPETMYKEAKRAIGLNPMRGIDYYVGSFVDKPTSTSEYGRNNTQEDYAEAFGYYMANKPMPEEIYNLFMRVSGLRKASRSAVARELLRVAALLIGETDAA